MGTSFKSSLRLMNNLIDEKLTVSLNESPRSTRGDVHTIAQFEDNENKEGRYLTTQVTIHIVDNTGKIYAEVIIQTFDNMPVSLIDWVEVIDREYWGNGIGRTLHEEAVRYIEEEKTEVNRIYVKIENPRMRTVNIDTGFKEIDDKSNEIWCRKNL